jgi:hypothetical protein
MTVGAWPRVTAVPVVGGQWCGAWRLWWEQPGEWADELHLFRRLGLTGYALEDEDIAQILLATDTDADYLRAVHLQGLVPDPLLLDCTRRTTLDGRIRTLVSSCVAANPQPTPRSWPMQACLARRPARSGAGRAGLG